MIEPRTLWIRRSNLDRLRRDIERLNRRAARIGVPPYVLEVTGERVREVVKKYEPGTEPIVKAVVGIPEVEISVAGEPVRFAGWTFAATIQHLGAEAGNILRVAPAFQATQVPTDYRKAQPVCDHCQAARRRADTYVLHHDDGTWKQVGSTCIRDFLGNDAARAIATAELDFDLSALLSDGDDPDAEAGDFRGMRERNVLGCRSFLSWVIATARAYGWLSRKAANEFGKSSTADIAISLMFKEPQYRRDDDPSPSAEDSALAEEVFAWGRDLAERDERQMNDYLWNLRAAFASEWVPWNAAGLVASAYTAFCRERERAILSKKKAAESKHVGEVGKRSVMTLTVTDTRTFESDYGVTTLVSFVDAEGAIVKWFATGDRTEEFKAGTTYTGKVSVKKHEVWGDHAIKQTMVNRCALEEVKS